jgi:glutathione S-transferase
MTTSHRPLKLHRFALSGHCHRVELLLSLLGLPVELIDVDLKAGAHKRPEYLKLNPLGQVPALEDGSVVLSESTAMLVYLASRYDAHGQWLPREPVPAAEVARWLSVAAGPLAHGPAAARARVLFGSPADETKVKAMAAQLFDVMDQHLAGRPFLVGERPTIADVALYAYTAHAPEGGVSLEPYRHIRAWIERVRALPRFVPMAAS